MKLFSIFNWKEKSYKLSISQVEKLSFSTKAHIKWFIYHTFTQLNWNKQAS